MAESPSVEDELQLWGTTAESDTQQNTSDILKLIDVPMEKHENFLKNKAKFSSKSLTKVVNYERSINILGHDPIGMHLIELRKYSLCVESLIAQASAVKYAKDWKLKQLKKLEPPPDIPPFPEAYPFIDSLESLSKDSNKKELTYEIYPSREDINFQRMYFIENVILQTGFYKADEEILQYLSHYVDEFLENITLVMRHYKDSPGFAESEDLMVLLEVTLRAIGYGGVKGLHHFYYHNFIKKHDIMLKHCIYLQEEYEKMIQNFPIVAKKSSEEESITFREEKITSEESLPECDLKDITE